MRASRSCSGWVNGASRSVATTSSQYPNPSGASSSTRDIFLVQEVSADDAEIDRAEPDVARNIVIASIEDGKRKVPAVGKEALAVALELQADGMQEIEGVLRQAPRALHRHLQRRITGGGATERLLEARCGVGHGVSGTSLVDLASVAEPAGNE